MTTLRKIGTCAFFVLMAGWSARAQYAPVAITDIQIPAGTVGVPYTYTFTATGGTQPYLWSAVGALPGLFTLKAATGAFAGTAQVPGTYTFTIQVADSAGSTASRIFALTINPAPLAITTESQLFNATVGQFYSQVFQASGGTAPYRWAVLQGQVPDGLTFDATAGTLTGTPTTAATYNLIVQVIDSSSAVNSKAFQLVVASPRLSITGSSLPAATAGTSYSQKLTATGGTPPYTWSLTGAVAGLQMDATTGTLSGIPPAAGSFTVNVQVADSAGGTATKALSFTVNPAALSISTSATLPDATLGAAYTTTFAAKGGVPPYTWSANGLPEGLTLDPATGVVTGAPLAGGALSFTVRVTDSARTTVVSLFHLSVGMPSAPQVQITGLPATANPADQPALRVTIGSAYPAAIAGQLSLTFAPDVGAGDSTIQFLTGGRTAAFTIPAGKTEAVFSAPGMAVQTGTVAGTITLSAQISAGGVDLTPNPAPNCSTHVNRGAPAITATQITRTTNGFTIVVTGYSTALEVTQAVFHFKATGGSVLQTADVPIALDSLFGTWYQDAAAARYGSQFTFTQPFTVQGDATAVTLDSVTLVNRYGSATGRTN